MKRYIKLDIPVTSVHVKGDEILTISRAFNANELCLSVLDPLKNIMLKVAAFKGSRNLLLSKVKDRMFVGVDNKLLASDDLASWKVVLESKNPWNLFWHITTSKNGVIYAQEYGGSPTGIYMSEDGEKWELLIKAQDIDRGARHFHSISYDPYRSMLIATLGDGNYTRIAVLNGDGSSWRSAYKGAWQVLPIVILKDRIVFGMDSGIARGGLIVWEPDRDKWQVIHLKRRDGGRFMQMSDLRLLSNGIWLAALGAPQAIIASLDLRKWYSVHIENLGNAFNYSMTVSEGKSIVAFSTGRSLMVASKSYIAEKIGRSFIAYEHKAFHEKFISFQFSVKRKIGL